MTHRFRCRLLAVDVDGTLLNSREELAPRTRQALREAADAGIRVVLATGRRYRRALVMAEPLSIRVPLVTHSGALLKDPADHRTLWNAPFGEELARAAFRVFARLGFPAIAYQDCFDEGVDYLTPTDRADGVEFNEYLALNAGYGRVVPDLMSAPPGHVFAACAVGSRAEMLALKEALEAALHDRLCVHVLKSPRYRGTMCEIMRADATKWAGVLRLAEQWGIAPEQICAVGDDVNDIPMLEGAGLGVAMGNAPEPVKNAADLITACHDNDGLAEVVETILLG